MQFQKFRTDDINDSFLSLIQQLRPHISSVSECEKIFTNIKNHNLFCITDDEKYVGFISFQKTFNLYLGEFYLVDDLIVDEKYRGKGIGKELMNAVEMACRNENISSIKLDSGLQRENTHKFYKSLGYEKKCYTFEKQL